MAIKLDVADATICKYKKASIIMDKKIQEHRIEHCQFIIIIFEFCTPGTGGIISFTDKTALADWMKEEAHSVREE